MKRGKFTLDRENGKLLGVCAGLARATGWDVSFIRVGLVVVTLAGAFPWTLVAYGIAAWMAKAPRHGFAEDEPVRASHFSTAGLNGSMRDIDRRLAEVETYVTAPNSTLAREIESLR
ncbi:MAG TPA: PspC domain-containing protein [Allosphingosinicella sp.]|jgi:phage shock protein C